MITYFNEIDSIGQWTRRAMCDENVFVSLLLR